MLSKRYESTEVDRRKYEIRSTGGFSHLEMSLDMTS